MSLHQHSMAIKKQELREAGLMKDLDDERQRVAGAVRQAVQDDAQAPTLGETLHRDAERIAGDDVDAENAWPYNNAERNTSKKAWWRTLGSDRNRHGAAARGDQ